MLFFYTKYFTSDVQYTSISKEVTNNLIYMALPIHLILALEHEKSPLILILILNLYCRSLFGRSGDGTSTALVVTLDLKPRPANITLRWKRKAPAHHLNVAKCVKSNRKKHMLIKLKMAL